MQILSQWRECCAIASLLATEHTPNHVLVNPILDYPPEDFEKYCALVIMTMDNRGYAITEAVKKKLGANLRAYRLYLDKALPWDVDFDRRIDWFNQEDDIFKGWHNKRYLRQCYYNLEEKFDRGAIPEDEWNEVIKHYILIGGAMKDE